jgi:competence protein ComEA
MTPLSTHSTGEASRRGPSRGGLTTAAVLLAVGLLAMSSPASHEVTSDAAPDLVVDPNTVRPEVFGALPKVGPALLRHLLSAREEHRFDSFDDLDRRVRGIGPATLAALRPHLRIPQAESP